MLKFTHMSEFIITPEIKKILDEKDKRLKENIKLGAPINMTFEKLIYYKYISDRIFNCKIKRKFKYKIHEYNDYNNGNIISYRLFHLKSYTNKSFPDIYNFYIKDYNIIGNIKIKYDNYFYISEYSLSDQYINYIFPKGKEKLEEFISNKTQIYNDKLLNMFIKNPNEYFDYFNKDKSEFKSHVINYLFYIYPYIYRKNGNLIFPKLKKMIIVKPRTLFKIDKIINI